MGLVREWHLAHLHKVRHIWPFLQRIFLQRYRFYRQTSGCKRNKILHIYPRRRDTSDREFHCRSRNNVEAIMKSFMKRVATADERGLNPVEFLRHELLSSDFQKLFNRLEAEGYFDPCITQLILRMLEATALTLFSLGLFFQCENILSKFISTVFCGFCMGRFGWLMHEGGHNSLSGWPRVDKLIQNMAFGFPLGLSSIECARMHTTNNLPSIFVGYFMGYMNYQIEHHLFPTMPQFRKTQVCHRVKELAKNHDLPYRVLSYGEACKLAFTGLRI